MRIIGWITICIVSSLLFYPTISEGFLIKSYEPHECKDIVAVGDATAGPYNLLLKVRDPSRPGPQVLCIVPKGHKYTYPLPGLRNNPQEFQVEHKFIGVVTVGDSLPNMVKAGVALSDAGIAYGDADSPSYWINPSPNAWDDFDWIRYACQTADNEAEAVYLLTHDVVDKFHAPAVSENLFVVGPKEAYLIEADAARYSVKKIDDICVMSNYPKELWKTRLLKRLFIAESFDSVNEKTVGRGNVIRLGALFGIKVVDVKKDVATVRFFPFGRIKTIRSGDGAVIGPFWVENLGCSNGKVKIKVMYKFNAWEQEMRRRVMERYGRITVEDMMNWSRLHSKDLKGLRGMCERENKAAAICKIPYDYPEKLSCMWFAPDQCSAIFVPVHISCNSIYEKYVDGSAADLSKKLLHIYGHGGVTPYLKKAERIFIKEIDYAENISRLLLKKGLDISTFLTKVDTEIQKQAYLTQQLLFYAHEYKEIASLLRNIWKDNYSASILNIRKALNMISDTSIRSIFTNLVISIANLKWAEFNILHPTTDKDLDVLYRSGIAMIKVGSYERGCEMIQKFLEESKKPSTEKPVLIENEREYPDYISVLIIVALVIAVAAVFSIRRLMH